MSTVSSDCERNVSSNRRGPKGEDLPSIIFEGYPIQVFFFVVETFLYHRVVAMYYIRNCLQLRLLSFL